MANGKCETKSCQPEKPLLRNGLIVLLGGICLAMLALIAWRAATIYDEGGYLYEGWLVVARGWQPFADFHTKTLPGLHYIYGIGQVIFGTGLLTGRIQAVILTIATLILSAAIARRVTGAWAIVIILGLFAFNLQAGVTYARALAIAPSAFFTMLSVYFITHPRADSWRLYCGSLAAAAVVMCRHDLIAIAVVIWAYILLRPTPHRTRAIGATATGIGAVLALCTYFYAKAPFQFSHVMFSGMFSPPLETTGGSYGRAVPFSVANCAWHLMLFMRWYSAPILLLTPALGHVIARATEAKNKLRQVIARQHVLSLLLTMAAANYLLHVLGSALLGLNIFYMLDFYIFFPVITAAAIAFMLAIKAVSNRSHCAQLAAFATVAMLLPIWTCGIPEVMTGDKTNPVLQINAGGQAIAAAIPPGSTIFTIDDPHQFLAARREIFPELTHQLFMYRDTPDTEEARRRHIFNRERIDEWLTGQAQYAVISDGFVDWMQNSGRHQDGAELRKFIFSRLESNYELIATVPDTYNGPMHIYRFKTSQPAIKEH